MWPKIYLLKSVATESCSLPLPGRGSRTDALRPHSSNNWSWVLSMCLLTQCWQVGVAGFAGLSLVLLQTYQLAADLPQPASSLLIHGPGNWLLFCQHVVVAPRHPLQLFGHGQVDAGLGSQLGVLHQQGEKGTWGASVREAETWESVPTILFGSV